MSSTQTSFIRIAANEALGTTLLIGIGMLPASLLVAPRAIDFAVSFFVGVLVAILVVDGDFNPAVSVGSESLPCWVWKCGRCVQVFSVRLLAQLAAAVLVSQLLLHVGPTGKIAPVSFIVPIANAVFFEVLYTFLLMLLVLSLRTARKVPKALTIASYVGVGAFFLGPLTGGSFNPARAFGPAVALHQFSEMVSPSFFLIYGIGPVLSATLAVSLYHLLKDQ